MNGQSSLQQRCGICFDFKPDSDMFRGSSKCNHPFCADCISKHVAAQIDKNVLPKVNCPNPNCCVELKPENLQPILPKQVFVLWETARARRFCAECKVPCHEGLNCNCKEFQKLDEKDLDRKFVELAKSEMWQRCPKCSIYVQRSGGCEHITCRCECNFCYMCGKDWVYGHTCN